MSVKAEPQVAGGFDLPEESGRQRLAMNANKPPLADLLRDANRALLEETAEWLASAARAPSLVVDDTALTNFGLIVKNLSTLSKKLDAAHTTEKAPYLEGSRACDEVFLTLTKRIAEAKKLLEARQTIYLTAKEAARKRQAAAEAEAARETERQAMRDAEREMDKGNFETAEEGMALASEAAQTAAVAERVLDAKPADLVRTYGTGGNVVSAQGKWVGVIDNRANMDLNELKSQFSDADIQKAVNAFVRLGGRSLKGVTITEERKAVNR